MNLKNEIYAYLKTETHNRLFQFADDIIGTKRKKKQAEWIATRNYLKDEEIIDLIMKNIDVKHYLSLDDFKNIFDIYLYIDEI